MKAVITGDIIDFTRAKDPTEGLAHLQEVLNLFGKSPRDWEVYRGDSFQLEIDGNQALKAAFLIKATLKTKADLEVRISIGKGTVNLNSDTVTRRNGTAYINSGRAFDKLADKKKRMVFQSDDKDLDHDINMVLTLTDALLASWTLASAEVIAQVIQKPEISQDKLSAILGITQPSVSARMRVAHVEEILAVLSYFSSRIER